MAYELSATEWNAKREKLTAQVAEEKFKQAERGLLRERKKTKLEDLEDRLLEIQVRSKESKVD